MKHTESQCRAIRRDGWTGERQLAFLAILSRTGSVAKAAAAVGMSRESAYRLRARPAGALFALQWDHAVKALRTRRLALRIFEGHMPDGLVMRRLGTVRRAEARKSAQGDKGHISAEMPVERDFCDLGGSRT